MSTGSQPTAWAALKSSVHRDSPIVPGKPADAQRHGHLQIPVTPWWQYLAVIEPGRTAGSAALSQRPRWRAGSTTIWEGRVSGAERLPGVGALYMFWAMSQEPAVVACEDPGLCWAAPWPSSRPGPLPGAAAAGSRFRLVPGR
jgi:hypothetical protein